MSILEYLYTVSLMGLLLYCFTVKEKDAPKYFLESAFVYVIFGLFYFGWW